MPCILFVFSPLLNFHSFAPLADFVPLVLSPAGTLEVRFFMRFRPVSLIRALLLLALVQLVANLPVPAASYHGSPQPSSVSGKVEGLSERQLTLSIGRDRTLNKLVFILDGYTQIEGALVVGARATVDYRTEGERLVATRIIATPASGLSAY